MTNKLEISLQVKNILFPLSEIYNMSRLSHLRAMKQESDIISF